MQRTWRRSHSAEGGCKTARSRSPENVSQRRTRAKDDTEHASPGGATEQAVPMETTSASWPEDAMLKEVSLDLQRQAAAASPQKSIVALPGFAAPIAAPMVQEDRLATTPDKAAAGQWSIPAAAPATAAAEVQGATNPHKCTTATADHFRSGVDAGP